MAKVAWLINNRNGIQLLWQVAVSASPAGLPAELDVAFSPQAEGKADAYITTIQCHENCHREVYTLAPELRGGND